MILDKIVESTVRRIAQAKEIVSLEKMKSLAQRSPTPFAFEKAINRRKAEGRPGVSFICEVKRASPSKGLLMKGADFPYVKIAQDYQAAGADAISVLTEPDYFQGSIEYLSQIRKKVTIPILQKDFFIDEYQIYEAAALHADAILLICAVLDADLLKRMIQTADMLGISCLVETHNRSEIETAVAAGARVIGVNNRDLETFETDVSLSIHLRGCVPEGILFVSESGIKTARDLQALFEHKADAVLIGEVLMRSGDIQSEVARLKSGNPVHPGESATGGPKDGNAGLRQAQETSPPKIKICGIRRFKDIEYVNEALPDFIGFVFAKSHRRVDFVKAYLLKSELDKRIRVVGVFVNEEIDFIKKCCDRDVIDMVQLHGDEDEDYILRLRKSVYKPIIKAVRVRNTERLETALTESVDFLLFDAFQPGAYGGTGQTFDWEAVKGIGRPFFLAGGIGISNAEEAARTVHPFCIDISSGVETNGVKDRQKIIDIIQLIRSVR